jgi:hypothetical protein
MVLAFTRLPEDQDLILVGDKGNFNMALRENLVPRETWEYEDEEKAFAIFERASRLLELATTQDQKAKSRDKKSMKTS